MYSKLNKADHYLYNAAKAEHVPTCVPLASEWIGGWVGALPDSYPSQLFSLQ